MSRLRLRLDVAFLHGGLPGYGVVANIYDVPDYPGRRPSAAPDRKRVLNLLIPAGSGWEQRPEFLDVDLEPGRYVVEAILPSAEVISKEVTVEESAEPQELWLCGAESPHEWLGWQHFVGNVQQDVKAYKRQLPTLASKAALNVRTEVVSVVTPPLDGARASEVSTPGALISRGLFFAVPSSVDIDPMRPLSDFFPFAEPDPPACVTPLNLYTRDEVFEIYETGDRPPEPDTARFDWPGDYRAPRFARRYLFVRGEGIPPQYSVLPIPWMQADHSGHAVVEALVQRTAVDPSASPGIDQGYRAAITVRDRLVGSVIGYLGTGQLPAAATVLILGRARDMLFEKVANPLAAAAGTYILLSMQESDKPQYWHDWVRNLMNFFQWLPDGAIQYAWVKLSQQRNEENLREARDSLLEGYRRGLPFYSKGVGLLMDGLTMFANDARAEENPDEEVEDALGTVRQLALRTNVRQPFTTVLLGE